MSRYLVLTAIYSAFLICNPAYAYAQIEPPASLSDSWQMSLKEDRWFRDMGSWIGDYGPDTTAAVMSGDLKHYPDLLRNDVRLARIMVALIAKKQQPDNAEMLLIDETYRENKDTLGLARLYTVNGKLYWDQRDPVKAGLLFDTAHLYYQRTSYHAELVDLQHRRIQVTTKLGQLGRGDSLIRAAVLLFPNVEKEDSSVIIGVLRSSVPIHAMRKEYEAGRQASLACIKYYARQGNRSSATVTAFNLSHLESMSGNIEGSIHALNQAMQYVDSSDTEQILMINAAVSSYQTKLGDFEEARETAVRWLPLAKETNNWGRLTTFYQSIGVAYWKRKPKELSKAIDYLELSVEAAQKSNTPRTEAIVTNTLGNVLMSAEQYEAALAAYERSADLANRSVKSLSTESLTGMINCYVKLDKLSKASELVVTLQQRKIEAQNFKAQKNKHYALLKYYAAIGQFKQMQLATDSVLKYSDSLRYQAANEEAQLMNARYKVNEEKAKTLLLEQEIITEQAISDRRAILAALLGLLAVGLISGLYLIRRREREKDMYTAALETKNIEIGRQREAIHKAHKGHTHDTVNQFAHMIGDLNYQQRKLKEQGVDPSILLTTRQQLLSYKTIQELVKDKGDTRIKLADYLDEYTAAIMNVHRNSEGQLYIDYRCAEVTVSATFASQIGRILQELITNSTKYARRIDGDLHVSIKVDKIAGDKIRLDYSDSGPALISNLPTDQYSSDSGMMIVRGQVEYMNGIVEAYGEDGFDFLALLPLG